MFKLVKRFVFIIYTKMFTYTWAFLLTNMEIFVFRLLLLFILFIIFIIIEIKHLFTCLKIFLLLHQMRKS